MADPYDPNDPDDELSEQREQAAYDQEEAAQQQQLWAPPSGGETFDANGQPVTQALPTRAPPLQAAAQPAPQQVQQQFETFDYNPTGQPQQEQQQQPAAPQTQPQQPQQRPLAPYPGGGVAARPSRGDRAAQERQQRFGTIISDETFDVSPEIRPQPTGGLGTVAAVEFMNFGHDMLSLVNIAGKQMGLSTQALEGINAQFKEHIDKVRDGLDPERRAAQDVSIFDPSSFAGKDAGAVAEAYAVTLATGIISGLGPGLAAKVATRAAARVVGAAAGAAGKVSDVAAIGTAGAVGGVQQSGARYEDYATTIDKMTAEDKQKSAMYQQYRAQNMSDAEALEAMKQQFPTLQQLGVNFLGATGLAAVTPGLGGVLPRLTSRTRNALAGAGEAGASVGAGTGASAAIQEQSKVAAGTQPAIDWGQVGAEAGVGALGGAAAGGVFGGMRAGRPAEPGRPPVEPPPFDLTTPAPPAGMLALPPPNLALPPPSTLALPAPPAMPGRRDTVTPGGVPAEHTAALNAAGIGRQAVETEPGAQQFRPPRPEVPIGADESFFGPAPPRYDLPAGTVLPPADPAAWTPQPRTGPEDFGVGAPPRPAPAAALPPGPEAFGRGAPVERPGYYPGAIPRPGVPLLEASRERGAGFTMQEPGTAPLQLTASQERGAGFQMPPEGAPRPVYDQPVGPFPPPSTGPGDFGIGEPPRPPPGPTPPPGPQDFGVGAPVQRQGYYPGAVAPPGPPRLEASRARGEGFTVAEPAAEAPRLAASRERGEGFTTEPPPAAPRPVPAAPEAAPAPRPSEGLSANELDRRLADYGLSKQQRNRLVGLEKKAAALDKLEQETRARGEEPPPRGAKPQAPKEEPAPAAPRGAESREQPAPAARPSEGMSHKRLGEALQEKGLSKREVNQILTKEARAFEYDKIVRDEEAALSRLGEKEQGENVVRTVMEAGPDETKGHPQGEREDRRWRALKPERTADGKYKGAPEWVQTPRHYRQLQRLMKQLVKEGEKGRFWYEESMKKIMQVTRGNLREAERVTGLVAIYSPQRPVPTNMGFAIKAYEQWHRGEPIRVGTESQDARAQRWLDTGQDWGGRKTNNFYLNLMHELITAHPEVLEPGNNRLNLPADVAAAIRGATVDLWVLRAMGHRVDAAGGPGGTGATGGITDKYGFSQLEIQRLAGELNASVPVGGQRWLPHQVQAALWSAIKARFELDAVKAATWKESLAAKFATMEPDKNGVLKPKAPEKNGPARQGHMAIWRKHALAASPADVARVIDTARGDFGAAIERMSQHVTVEAIPSKDLGHPIYDASTAAKEQFTREAHALILDEDGNNLLAQKVGVNLGYDTYGAGSFKGKVSPNVVTTLVPEKPAGFFDRTKARMYARAAQFIYRQDAVPFFRADRQADFEGDYSVRNENGKVIKKFDTQAEAQAHADRASGRTIEGGELAQGVHLEFDRNFDEVMQARLLAELGKELGPDAGFTKVGDNDAVVINFRGDNGIPFIDDVQFGNALGRIAGHDELGVKTVTHFGSEGEYGPVQDWKGGSAAASSLAEAAGGSPAFQQWLRDRHAAFGKLLDDWSDPEARLAASRPRDGRGAGPPGRSSLELPETRAPPDARAARERAAEQRAERVEGTPEAEAPPVGDLERPYSEASRAQRNQPTATESPLSRVMKDDRVNAPVREAIDRGGSLHDGLRAIANNPYINKRLPHVAAYARSMLRLAPDLELRPSETVRRGAFVSEEDLNTGRRSEHIEVREKSAEVMLHEATHTVVGHYVDSLQPGSREFQVLTTIRDEFRRGAEAHGRLGDEQVAYALSNPHELHSMLRTNPEMHDLMRGIVPTAEYRTRMAQLGYPVGAAKSLWQSFVRFVRQALHLPQNVTSLMDHVMRPLDDIAEAGARFNRDLPASTRDSMVYRRGWDQEPLVARTEHELPSFSQARAAVREYTDTQGVAGNYTSQARRVVRQFIPTEQLTAFNRHLFNPSSGGENILDVLNRAREGVERVSREYGEAKVGPTGVADANGQSRERVVNEAIRKLSDAEVNKVLTSASRVDTNPAQPLSHWTNSHSRATPDEFKALQAEYNALSSAQRQVVTSTFDLTRQQRIDRGDAAMRGIGKAYLEGVNDAQVETMVRQMRTMDGVNDILANRDTNAVAKAFGDQWDGNREFVRAIATEWKRGWINNYVPLHRSGDWVVTYTDPDSGEAGMLSRYTQREAETARQQLIKDGAEPSLVLSREHVTPSDIPRLTMLDRFQDKLERNPAFDPAQAAAARDLLAKVLLDQSRFAGSMRKRLGVHGADPSKLPEAMAQNFMALKNAMGHLEFGPQYEAALGAMRRHVGEMGRGAGTVNVEGRAPTSGEVQTAQQLMEEVRRRKPVSEDPNNILLRGAHNATLLTYFKMLASPAQTIMNGIETYMQGIPRIGAQFGLGRATTAMARASAEIMPRQFARGVGGTGAAARGRLDPGEWNSGQQIRDHLIAGSRRNDAAGMTALFQRLQDGALIGYSSYRDLQNMAKGGAGRVRRTADWAADMVSILHSKMEDANRAVTALAAYDVHLQRHGNRAAAIDYAEKILRRSAPNFNLGNKPRFATSQGGFGAWGIPIAQFRQHGMWAYSQFALDIRNAFKGADAQTKSEARYALAFTIGMQTVLLGTLNWLADPMRYLFGAYDALAGNKPRNYEHDFRIAANNILGPTWGELASRGITRAGGYGLDVSHRVGMINPLGIPEFQGDYRNPKDIMTTALTALVGAPAISAGSQVVAGLFNFSSGNFMQAGQDLLPKVLSDPLKAYAGETEGTVTRRGRLTQTPEQISTLDTVYRVLGFTSARQGERTARYGAEKQFIDRVQASREEATKEAARVLASGSASERRAAAQLVNEHNTRYPGSKIDFKDVAAHRKREVERLRDPTLAGMTVSQGLRAAVREQGAFANY